MSDPRGPGWTDPAQGSGGYPPNTDPAYSGHWGPPPYGTAGSPGYGYPQAQPTEQLPPYWQPGQPGAGYPGAPPPPPEPPKKTSKWLWAGAIAALLLVTGLVLALVIVSNSTKDATIVAPPTSQTSLPSRTLTPPGTTTIRPPTRTAVPAPLPVPTETLEPTVPGAPPTASPTGTETVVYSVGGQGRAINITYVDTGGIMQTEFNVALPWSKEVSLAAPARTSASVAVVNIGRDVTCSVSVNGAMVRQRSGRGLTICTGAA